jgi:hypothetical protein
MFGIKYYSFPAACTPENAFGPPVRILVDQTTPSAGAPLRNPGGFQARADEKPLADFHRKIILL